MKTIEKRFAPKEKGLPIKEKQEYEEYVESFAHEIKIPIGALSLTFDNTKNYALKKETDKLYRLTEHITAVNSKALWTESKE